MLAFFLPYMTWCAQHNHSALRSRVAHFQRSLFDDNGRPLVRGLDRSIVIDPRRLHITLGVMALGGENNSIQDALAMLDSLRPQLQAVLDQSRAVQVKFQTMDILKTKKRNNSEEVEAHVLYLGLGPSEDDETLQLRRVCGTETSSMMMSSNQTRHYTWGI